MVEIIPLLLKALNQSLCVIVARDVPFICRYQFYLLYAEVNGLGFIVIKILHLLSSKSGKLIFFPFFI